jgi:hypothetical protein
MLTGITSATKENAMQKYFAALFLALVPSLAGADERFMPHIEWLVENSDLTYDGQPLPSVTYMSYPVLEVTVYGPETVAKAEHNGTELPKLRGSYDHIENRMLLPEGFDWEANQEVIVHELVHFLQYLGDTPDCVQELERPAYELHWQWVEEHDYPAEEPNWLFVYMLETACRDHHQ